MAPQEKFHLALRWEFAPLQAPGDGAVRWIWRAYTQAGRLSMEAEAPFDTLTECMEDAKQRGYGGGR
jgi:hypothetical protein